MMINANNGSKPDVFLSYSHNDSAIVETIAEKLTAVGFTCWIDKEQLRAQENFNTAIDEAIDGSIVFLSFLSKTYVNKPYCIHEFDRAIDKQRSILAVCIDDVNESTNRQCAYMFSFCAGHNILGFGSGVSFDDLSDFSNEIIHSVPLEALRRYNESGDSADFPPISTPDYLIARLRLYHEKQYRQSGNYALNEIRGELFSAIKDPEINVLYKDDNNNNVSLIRFFSDTHNTQYAGKHILITGEGGMGKTVLLLKTCEFLLSNRINAIYVPLSKIDEDLTLDEYIERVVCGGNQRLWKDIRNMMSAPYKSVPNVVLLLDGINEVSLNYVEVFIKKVIKSAYVDSLNGVQLVISSRWFDTSIMHRLREDFILLEMQLLDDDAIDAFSEHVGIERISDEKIRAVIRTPLMLTLYSDVEKHRVKYQNIEGINLDDHPNTAGKILGNFFQAQLFRAAEEENFDRASHLVLLEYLLPELACKMVEQHSLYISEDDIWDSIDNISDGCERYKWYKNDKLRKIIRGRNGINVDALIDLAESSLHFLHKSESGYEFLHQSFRDYFAAYHISNEVRSLKREPSRKNKIIPVLQQQIYSDEILNFVSDIVYEESAMPELGDSGWIFPGKANIGPSNDSEVEALLDLWRNDFEESAQNAVANIVTIMRIGRRNHLGWCDFSYLDLRKCWLNECRFSEWYKEKLYPSNFDGAYINRENFVTDGHEAQICVLLSDGERYLFSGDKAGYVKIYDLITHDWKDSIQLQSDRVVDLAWDGNSKILAVLYKNIIFCYSLGTKKVLYSIGNDSQSKSFRYVKFDDDNELNVAYDIEPLIWYHANGTPIPCELSYDVPSKCAKWHPYKKEFIRSQMLQLLSVCTYQEETRRWELHYSFKKALAEENVARKKNNQKPSGTKYISLRDFGAVGSGSISCINYKPDGAKVLVAIQNILVEFDAEQFIVLHKKTFSAHVSHACYIERGVAVAVGSNIVLLDHNFSEDKELRGAQIQPITIVSENLDGTGYVAFSSNGEIKKLSRELVIQNMRYVGKESSFAWARDRITDEIQMVFLHSKKYPHGLRYSYDTDRTEPLGWSYELIDTYPHNDDVQRVYKMDAQLMTIGNKPPYRKILFTNYTGIWIYGCSFNGINGEMKEPRNQKFLIQNGGVIDAFTEQYRH